MIGSVQNSPTIGAAQLGDAPAAAPSDATAQAALLLGYLAFLAQGYANATDPAQKSAILAQFQQALAEFQINGGTVTFSYNEGQQTVTITDPTIVALLQAMPKDITAFNTWWNTATTPPGGTAATSPMGEILNWLQNDQFNFNSGSSVTSEYALFFMLSAMTSPIGQESGITADFLDLGWENGAILENSFIAAQLLCSFMANDPTLNPSVIADCLNGALNDPTLPASVQRFIGVFNENYQQWIKNPPLPGAQGLAMLIAFEERYWPYYYTPPAPQTIHAVALKGLPKVTTTSAANQPEAPDLDKYYKS